MNRPALEPSDLRLFLFPIVSNVVVLLSIKYHLVSNYEDDCDGIGLLHLCSSLRGFRPD